ncbi:MAG: recombination mediator RecR [Candidatus Saccharibacteria bacterium]|nr:recombination mediator RecR [Candidatus Saccharibacteria bacterium]
MQPQQNNNALPEAMLNLIDAFSALPGVGRKTAERYAYACLKSDKGKSQRLASCLHSLHDDVRRCPITFALIDASDQVSPLYSGPDRDKQLVAVVEDPFDVLAIEATGQFKGTYHVLGGVISPIDGIGPDELHIPELIKRLKQDEVGEVILATNASVEGESTALYIQKQLSEANLEHLRVSRLARGIPIGVDLEYADKITLGHALSGRKQM